MNLNPTLRRNGAHMVTIKVSYTVGKDEAIDILADYRTQELFEEDDPRATKALVSKALRRSFEEYGTAAGMKASDNLADHDDGDNLREWATEAIERLYPEWT